jgi:hypothetical protein
MTAIVCMALSAAGLVIALLTAVRRRIRAAFRWTALALVPTGLYLTGLIPVFDRIGRSLGSWATHLVFDPRVWTGLGLLGLSVLILLATGLGRGRRSAKAATGPARPAASARPAGAALSPAPAPSAHQKSGAADPGDFSDVEEILKRRGL